MARFSEYLKVFLLVIIILQFLPPIVRNIHKQITSWSETNTQVGVVPITGVITNAGKTIKHLKKFFNDESIKAIVLKIDSPGGTPGAAQAIFQEIKDLKQDNIKPVIAYTENMCTSAAYYIACAADHIICQPSTLMGSIGVFIGYPNLQDFIEQYKIKYTTVQSGDYKMAGTIFKDLTPQQRTMLQALTDDTYQQFVKDVASQRTKVAAIDPKKWADGQTFSGRKAVEIGLADEVGSQTTLIKALKAKAPIEGEIVWVRPPKPGMLSSFFGKEDDDEFDDGMESETLGKTALSSVVDFLSRPTSI